VAPGAGAPLVNPVAVEHRATADGIGAERPADLDHRGPLVAVN